MGSKVKRTKNRKALIEALSGFCHEHEDRELEMGAPDTPGALFLSGGKQLAKTGESCIYGIK